LVRIPTYLLLVIASTLAYYFFSGVRAFAMIYFTQHYHIGRGEMGLLAIVAGLGAVAGAIMGGRLSEVLLRRGFVSARIVLPGLALLAACILIGPGIWITSLIVGTVLLTGGIGALAAANAPIDAARLDIVPSALWARGEGGRMALRGVCEGGAPVLFGAMSGWLGGGQTGLQWTFLIMLIPVLIAAGLSIPARRSYPRDVATAAASMRKAERSGHSDRRSRA
jgi:MFS family permease